MTVAGELVRLRDSPLADLRTRYLELTGQELETRDREEAWKRLARALQSGAPGAVAAEPETLPLPPPPRRRVTKPKLPRGRCGRPVVGTVLVRVWHGVEHRITVVDGGYALNGQVFKTASALARHVTGQHWNGRLWLGLKQRTQKAKR